MPSRRVRLTRRDFLKDRQGKTFADVADNAELPFSAVIEFLNDGDRQRRMEESELHHDRPALAGVVREFESISSVNEFLSGNDKKRITRFRQATGVLVRMIMERRGWEKTGRKGSLGVRAAKSAERPAHNSGGLAFWFIRGERYRLQTGMPYRTVRERCKEMESSTIPGVNGS